MRDHHTRYWWRLVPAGLCQLGEMVREDATHGPLASATQVSKAENSDCNRLYEHTLR